MQRCELGNDRKAAPNGGAFHWRMQPTYETSQNLTLCTKAGAPHGPLSVSWNLASDGPCSFVGEDSFGVVLERRKTQHGTMTQQCASVAKWLMRSPCKRKVPCSIHGGGTFLCLEKEIEEAFLFLGYLVTWFSQHRNAASQRGGGEGLCVENNRTDP